MRAGLPPAPKHLRNAFPEERWNPAPTGPQDSEGNAWANERFGRGGAVERDREDRERKGAQEEGGNDGDDRQEEPGPKGDARLRGRQVAAPAPGTRLGPARVRVQSGTELHVVAAAARIAEQRFPRGAPTAVVAVSHGTVRGACDAPRRPDGAMRRTRIRRELPLRTWKTRRLSP